MVDVRKHLALLQGGLLDKPYRQLSVRAVQGFALSSRLRMPLHQATLRTISEAPLHIEIRHKHCPHHVRAGNMARSLEIRMEISRDVQSPQALRPRVTTRVQGPVLRPPSRSGAATSNSGFDFQCVVSGFRYPSHEDAIPVVAVSPAIREHV